ncbi:MAG: helix-turn-helix domain-containing protein [Verrucomicrobiota bacterium]|nr:helix-turn-helix domain-containing protein [Verrucomicrobiota bacterium]
MEDTSLEGLGRRFQEARKARGLSLDQAARLTKIRQSRLVELEADDFANFPSLAYAKGFLQIYGKFLNVDVSPFMEAFETPGAITVDGYSYLQDNPAPKPQRLPTVRQDAGPKTSLTPLFVGIAVLVLGFMLVKFFLNLQRITAPRSATVATTSAAQSATPATIVAPRAQPVENPNTLVSIPAATPAAIAVATPLPSATEPEVRRAEPVNPSDLVNASANDGLVRIDIKPLRKTYVRVTKDDASAKPVYERWMSPSDGVVEFSGHRFNVRVLDREAVQIRKNGKVVSASDSDVTVE